MTTIGTVNPSVGQLFAGVIRRDSGTLPDASWLAGKPKGKKSSDPVSDFINPSSTDGPRLVEVKGELNIDNSRATPGGAHSQKPKPPPNSGVIKAGTIANPPDKKDGGFTASQKKIQETVAGQRFNKEFGTEVIPLAGDRQVNLRALMNGTLIIEYPYQQEPSKHVHSPVPGVNLKTSTPQQIKQAVQTLCNNNRSVPYVYDRGSRPIYNWGNPTPTVKQSVEEKCAAQREAYTASIREWPPIVKELAGVVGGIWFETLGKAGVVAEELIDTMQDVAEKITASPAAWKSFIDSNFAGDDLDARLYRKLLGGGMPQGGAGDGKTTVAILMGLDRKFGIQARSLTTAVATDPVGVGQKFLAGLKQMAKQELNDLNGSDPFVALGTLLAKVVFGVIPLAKGSIEGARLLKSAVVASAPKLLKTMGKAGFESAVASIKLADAKLVALATKAKLPGGLSAAEKVQQTALTSQLRNAAKAVADNDPKALKDASAALNKTLRNDAPGAAGDAKLGQRSSEATPKPKTGSRESFYDIPHPGGRKFIENSRFPMEGQSPATFGNGRIRGLDIGDRLFNSIQEADAALARFIAEKPQGEYSIRVVELQHPSTNTKKYLTSIEPSEKKNLVTHDAQQRQVTRLNDWGSANDVRLTELRFDHNHPGNYGKATTSAIPSGVQDAKNAGDIQTFLHSPVLGTSNKFAIWAQDKKTVVKLEFTIKAWPLEEKLRTLSEIKDRSLFSKLFNDCFDVKLQKFDHGGNKIGASVTFDVMGAIAKERRDSLLESAGAAFFAGFGLYKAKEWVDGKGNQDNAPGAAGKGRSHTDSDAKK